MYLYYHCHVVIIVIVILYIFISQSASHPYKYTRIYTRHRHALYYVLIRVYEFILYIDPCFYIVIARWSRGIYSFHCHENEHRVAFGNRLCDALFCGILENNERSQPGIVFCCGVLVCYKAGVIMVFIDVNVN